MSNSSRKNALGKGLGALLGAKPVSVIDQTEAVKTGTVRYIPIGKITPNPHQPRKTFSRETIEELSASIKQHGILQPIMVVSDKRNPGHYTLVAGERRFRAATAADLKEIPALVSDITEEEMLEIAIVENVQREDLNPVEEAKAYRQLIDQFGWSQEEVADRVGKNRTTVANSLRLLKLGEEALRDLEEGRMTAGHARALLAVGDSFYRARLRQMIVEKGVSVREAERLAKSFEKAGPPTGKNQKKNLSSNQQALDTVALQERLMDHLGCRVRVHSKDGQSGSIEIPFQNLDELERFLEAINLSD